MPGIVQTVKKTFKYIFLIIFQFVTIIHIKKAVVLLTYLFPDKSIRLKFLKNSFEIRMPSAKFRPEKLEKINTNITGLQIISEF